MTLIAIWNTQVYLKVSKVIILEIVDCAVQHLVGVYLSLFISFQVFFNLLHLLSL